jgi:hypothetical protein
MFQDVIETYNAKPGSGEIDSIKRALHDLLVVFQMIRHYDLSPVGIPPPFPCKLYEATTSATDVE